MKNKVLILALGLVVLLSGCGKKQGPENKENLPAENPGVSIEKENPGEENLPAEKENPDQNLQEEDVEDTGEENPEEEGNPEEDEENPEGEEVSQSLEEEIKALEEKSDYISIIKMSQTGPNGKEIHVVEDLKGSLKNIVLPEIPNMQPNYNYLIFLMDSETGDITLTDANRGLILIENDTDQRLLIIKDLLKPEESTEEN